MMVVEDAYDEPSGYHYFFRRGGDSATERQGAEQHLAAQGCSRVLHYARPAGAFCSFGYVEPVSVVRQRSQEPQYG